MEHDEGVEVELFVDVSHVDGVAVVTVRGEIDMVSASVLQAALDLLESERHVVVDCGSVHFMDSTGLRLIVEQSITREQAGGSLRLRNTSYPVHQVVETTGLIQLFELEDV